MGRIPGFPGPRVLGSIGSTWRHIHCAVIYRSCVNWVTWPWQLLHTNTHKHTSNTRTHTHTALSISDVKPLLIFICLILEVQSRHVKRHYITVSILISREIHHCVNRLVVIDDMCGANG